MSSSRTRIIRQGGEGQTPYTLEPLGDALPDLSGCLFRPVVPGVEEPEEMEVQAEPAPEPPGIPEEDALRMVRDARAEGVREGREQAEGELEKVTAALSQALQEAASLRAQVLHEAEDDLLKLSMLIARKVMLRELSCQPGIMAGLVRGALEQATGEGEIAVRLNPKEHQIAASCRDFQELLRENPRITLKADPAVPRAGCLLETVRGNIDAGVDAQLEEIMRRLCDEKSGRRHEGDETPAPATPLPEGGDPPPLRPELPPPEGSDEPAAPARLPPRQPKSRRAPAKLPPKEVESEPPAELPPGKLEDKPAPAEPAAPSRGRATKAPEGSSAPPGRRLPRV